jgi:hypothetical protein
MPNPNLTEGGSFILKSDFCEEPKKLTLNNKRKGKWVKNFSLSKLPRATATPK